MSTEPIPDEALFHISEEDMSLEEKAFQLYESPSNKTIEHFKWVNRQLEDGKVKKGEMVILTPEESSACKAWEENLAEKAIAYNEMVATMRESERRIAARYYAVLADTMAYGNTGAGWLNNHFATRKKQVETILKELEQLHRSTYAKHGDLKGSAFYQKRAAIFSKLESSLGNGIFRRQLFRKGAERSRIKSQLGLSTKSVAHQFKVHGVNAELPQFKANQKNLLRTAKTFKGVGYLSIGLDVAASSAKIAEVCTKKPNTPQCTQTQYAQTGRASGSIAGGVALGYIASYGGCALVLGLTTGPGALACGVVVGGVGGYAGSQVGGNRGKAIGNSVYRTTVRPAH